MHLQHLDPQIPEDDKASVIMLADRALEAARRAYPPYSRFLVGAALVTSSGRIYTGSNMENAAYEGGPHAETSALVAMNAAGERDVDLVVCVGYLEGEEQIIGLAPCGGCRQKLYEIASLTGRPIRALVRDEARGLLILKTIDELLPYAFGPADIGIELERYRR